MKVSKKFNFLKYKYIHIYRNKNGDINNCLEITSLILITPLKILSLWFYNCYLNTLLNSHCHFIYKPLQSVRKPFIILA